MPIGILTGVEAVNLSVLPVSFIYLAGVVLVNLGFAYLPILDTPLGPLPTMSFFVGFIFVIRDFAQRRIGHDVVYLMIVAAAIVWLLADAQLALASTAAFFLAELADWLVYTITKKPFHQRVLVSSLASVPVDTVVFLGILGFLSPGSFVIMNISKFAAAGIIWYIWKKRKLQ